MTYEQYKHEVGERTVQLSEVLGLLSYTRAVIYEPEKNGAPPIEVAAAPDGGLERMLSPR